MSGILSSSDLGLSAIITLVTPLTSGHIRCHQWVVLQRQVEETGVVARPDAKTRQGPWINTFFKEENRHFVSIFTHIDLEDCEGEPQNLEPEKCEGWQWFDAWDLPQPLFLPLKLLVEKFDITYVMHTLAD